MPSTKPKITCVVAQELKLTQREYAALKKTFRTAATQVLSARRGTDLPPFPEININSGQSSGSSAKTSTKGRTSQTTKKKY